VKGIPEQDWVPGVQQRGFLPRFETQHAADQGVSQPQLWAPQAAQGVSQPQLWSPQAAQGVSRPQLWSL